MIFGVGSKDGFGDKEEWWVKLLCEAIFYFNNVISMDLDYVLVYLNKVCVYYMLGDNEWVVFYVSVEVKCNLG